MELSPNRAQQSETAQRDGSRERREGRGSPPPLNRPLSLPLDPKFVSDDSPTGQSKSSSLQRYKDTDGIKEKAVRWRERKSEGEPTDESSPEIRRQRVKRKDDYQ